MTGVPGGDLAALPKAELHLHLEGALRPQTAAELADRYRLPLPRTGRFAGLPEFVAAYEEARDLIGTLDDLHRVAGELLTTARENGVVWTEVHLIPPTYAGRLGPDEAVLEAVLDGLAAAASPAEAVGVLLAAGAPVSLNTDCPLFLGTTTAGEYATARDAFGLPPGTLAAIAETSLRTSSCPPERRDAALAGAARWRAAVAA